MLVEPMTLTRLQALYDTELGQLRTSLHRTGAASAATTEAADIITQAASHDTFNVATNRILLEVAKGLYADAATYTETVARLTARLDTATAEGLAGYVEGTTIETAYHEGRIPA